MTAEQRSLAWWMPDSDQAKSLGEDTKAERGKLMVEAQKLIATLPAETYRRDRDIDHVRLYESSPNVTLYDFAGRYYADQGAVPLAAPDDSTDNKAKAAIDTLMSQVASTDQRARYKVVDGDYRQRRRAREMQCFTDGLVNELDLHELKQRAALDAAILESGVGAIQFYRDGEGDGDRCAAQRVLATELSVDPRDGMVNGEWRTLYRRRPMPRAKIYAEFGDNGGAKDKAIADARAVDTGSVPIDEIEVFEAWHLPTSKKAGDGWHVIALDVMDAGSVMLAEPYEKAFHEIVFFSWERRFTTGWGLSLMAQVRKLQRRINARNYRIDRAEKLFMAGHLYVDRAAHMKPSFFTNEIGSVWEGDGPNPPKQVLFSAATPEAYAQNERDGQRIFENLGINIAAAQASDDAGLDASGASLRERKKSSDKRNSVRQQRWERFHLVCVRVALSVVRDIVTHTAEGGKRTRASGYKVAAPGKRGLRVVDWTEAAIDEKDYVVEICPASPIPTDPAGLMAFGKEMVDLGAWKPSDLAGYMQDLDAEGRVNRQMAQTRRLEKTFEALLYDKTASALPDEFTNYVLALEIGTEYLAQGEEDEVPEKHLERVRRYLKRCKKLDAQAKASAAAAAMPPAPPGAAPALPVDPAAVAA